MTATSLIPPAAVFILGALLIPLLRGRARSVYMLLLPAAALWVISQIPGGTYTLGTFLGHAITLKIDSLSLVFAYAFLLITFIGVLYALHVKESSEHAAAFIYAGSALGVVFAGDLVSLFIFWEILTISAGFIIWTRGTRAARGAGMRYLLVHIFGGMCLLAGIILHIQATGSAGFGYIGTGSAASYLILAGFMINVAAVPLHAWLTDAYPEASVTGTIFLSVYTTKTAVYVLARAFPGADILVVAGTVMAVYPIFYAVLENDLRRVLSYSLINQVGFMVVGVGIGIPLAINGAAAHAFADILFKSLLFMSVGAVMYRTGTAKATELGGLYKTMPFTTVCCLVGAASISAFPLFSAFATKSMITSAAGHEHMLVVWLFLIFASAGVFHHAGIKIPYFTFFAHDSGKRPAEAPVNMRAAMGIAAFLCIFIGVYPQPLYGLLPHAVNYAPYTAGHVLSQLLLLFFASLAFTVLMLTGYYPPEQRSVNLDTDWFYRKAGPVLVSKASAPVAAFNTWLGRVFLEDLPRFLTWFGQNPTVAVKMAAGRAASAFAGPERKQELRDHLESMRENYAGYAPRPWSIGSAVSSVLVFFLAYLLLYLF